MNKRLFIMRLCGVISLAYAVQCSLLGIYALWFAREFRAEYGLQRPLPEFPNVFLHWGVYIIAAIFGSIGVIYFMSPALWKRRALIVCMVALFCLTTVFCFCSIISLVIAVTQPDIGRLKQ